MAIGKCTVCGKQKELLVCDICGRGSLCKDCLFLHKKIHIIYRSNKWKGLYEGK